MIRFVQLLWYTLFGVSSGQKYNGSSPGFSPSKKQKKRISIGSIVESTPAIHPFMKTTREVKKNKISFLKNITFATFEYLAYLLFFQNKKRKRSNERISTENEFIIFTIIYIHIYIIECIFYFFFNFLNEQSVKNM